MRLPAIRAEVIPPLIHKEEGFGQTDINESFADDSSNLFLFSLKSLYALKNVLTDFKNISGLSSNFEKSFIMRIGDTSGAVSQDILDLGFTFTDKIKLLGFTLQNFGDITAANFEGVRTKIDNLIRFWERFFLSLPGRITIYKTLLIPQINYYASILTPSYDTILNLQRAMEGFVLGGLTIARDRIYKKVEEGGLGLFNLSDFISALQCTWIKRCVKSVNDNWRYRLALYGNGNPTLVVNDGIVKGELGTVLNNLMDSFCKFKGKYTIIDNNYLHMPIYCNPVFGYGRGLMNKLDEQFFEINGDMIKRNLVVGITWNNLSNNGRLLSRVEIQARYGISFTAEKYDLLKTAFRICKRKYHKDDEKSLTMRQFICGFKKGSRNFRKIISKTEKKDNMADCRAIQTYGRTVGVRIVDSHRASSIMSNWNKSFLPSNVRVFIFKYYNNMLGLNSRVAHFNREVNASCTFCTDRKVLPADKETMTHLFFHCPSVQGLITEFSRKYLRDIELETAMFFTSEATEFEKKITALI